MNQWLSQNLGDIQFLMAQIQELNEKRARLGRIRFILMEQAQAQLEQLYGVAKFQVFTIEGKAYQYAGLAEHYGEVQVILMPPQDAPYPPLWMLPYKFIQIIPPGEPAS